MKNLLWITLTDVKGSRQFGVSRRALKRFFSGIAIVLCGLIVYPLWLNSLNAKGQVQHQQLLAQHEQLQQAHQQLQLEREALNQQLVQRTKDYELSTEQYALLIDELNFKEKDFLNESERFNDALYEVGFRRLVLQLIPNGRPTAYDRVTSSFGNRMHPLMKVKYQHKGIDVHSRIGTPVHATADGVVTSLQNTEDGFGKLVKIDHAFGFRTYYGHLKTISADWYQVVKKGDIIGYSGNTGRSTGPHLHYEVRFGDQPLDPANFILWNINSFEKQIAKIEEIPWESLMDNLQNLAAARPQPLSPKIATSPENSILTVACTSTEGCLETSNAPLPSLSGSRETSMAK